MRIYAINKTAQTFNGKSLLKQDFLSGLIPLKRGVYGGLLNRDKAEGVTVEHIIPKSKGGRNCEANYFLANKQKNWERGSEPLEKYLKLKPFVEYLRVMLDVNTEHTNGVQYVKDVLDTVIEALNKGL